MGRYGPMSSLALTHTPISVVDITSLWIGLSCRMTQWIAPRGVVAPPRIQGGRRCNERPLGSLGTRVVSVLVATWTQTHSISVGWAPSVLQACFAIGLLELVRGVAHAFPVSQSSHNCVGSASGSAIALAAQYMTPRNAELV